MKTLAAIVALQLVTSWTAWGKAYFFSRSELVAKASVIAIITLEEPEPGPGTTTDPFIENGTQGQRWTYRQQAKMRVEKVIKGSIASESTLYGGETFICAQCTLSKGRFLAFLIQDEGLWVGANWQLSLRPIRANEVEWYVAEEQRSPMTFQKLDDVISQIQATLKKPGPTNP